MEASQVRNQVEFSKIDEHSTLLSDIIDQENLRRTVPSVNSTFDPARLTECPRRLLYRCNGTDHSPLKSYLDLQSDISIKNKWIKIFGSSHKIKVQDKVVVADATFNITGSPDIVFVRDYGVYLGQIKPVSNEVFKRIILTGSLKKDVVETIIYIWLMEIKDGFLLYDNKDNGGYLVVHVLPYKPIIKTVKEICKRLISQKIDGILPERRYKFCDANECQVCEFKDKCW